MREVDWEAIERLLQPLYPKDPLADWACANRIARHAAHVSQGLKPFDSERARLLAMFHGLGSPAAEPSKRARWARPLKDAGVPIEDQTWLWLALMRYRNAPESHEERAVRDARLLETVGALGVALAMVRAGQTGDSLQSAVQAAHQALNEAEFMTPTGRRLGVRRVVVARRFLKELEEE
ncbi:MAG TPA: hypothetical protein VGM51_19470 [Armatimonadota bacterium]|jgi:hypothetical protein